MDWFGRSSWVPRRRSPRAAHRGPARRASGSGGPLCRFQRSSRSGPIAQASSMWSTCTRGGSTTSGIVSGAGSPASSTTTAGAVECLDDLDGLDRAEQRHQGAAGGVGVRHLAGDDGFVGAAAALPRPAVAHHGGGGKGAHFPIRVSYREFEHPFAPASARRLRGRRPQRRVHPRQLGVATAAARRGRRRSPAPSCRA